MGAPFLPVPNALSAVIGGTVLTLAYVAAIVGFGLTVARRELPIPVALTFLVFCVLVWLGVEQFMRPPLLAFGRALTEAGGEPTFWQQLTYFYVSTLQDLALISGALFSGALLSRGIRYPNMLGPIGAIIALIDTWGVLFSGPVSQLMSNKATQGISQRAMASGPRIGAVHAAATGISISVPSVGVGDFLFVALLLCTLVNLKMNWRASAWLMWVFISFALISLNLFPTFPALPGLVFIGGAAVLPNFKYFSYTRDERFALLWAGLLVLVLTGGIYVWLMRALPPDPKGRKGGPLPVPRAASPLSNASASP